MLKRSARLLSLLLMLCLLCTSAWAAGKETVIRVGWDLVPMKHEYYPAADPTHGSGEDVPGAYGGYEYEYLKRIAEFTGWKYKFFVGPFDELFDKLLKGEIDLMGDLSWRADRTRLLYYPENSNGGNTLSLITGADSDAYDPVDYEHYDGMRIGALSGSTQVTQLKSFAKDRNFKPLITEMQTYDELYEALKKKTLDAIVVSSLSPMEGLKVLARLPFEKIYFAASRQRPDIARGIDDAVTIIKSLQPNYEELLSARYFVDLGHTVPSFTKSEKAWLRERIASGKPVLTSYDPAWMPIEYRDPQTNEMHGVMADVFARLSEITGLKFQFVTAENYAATTAKFKDKAEAAATLSTDYIWAGQHNSWLTQPIFSVPVVTLILPDRYKSNVVALSRGYHLTRAVEARLKEQQNRGSQPFSVVYFDTMKQCINAVRRRVAGRTYINMYELNYYTSRNALGNLNVQVAPGFSESSSISVSKTADRELFTVISKALAGISTAEINSFILRESNLRTKLTVMDFLYAYPLSGISIAVTFVALAGLVFFFRYRSIKDKRESELLSVASRAKSSFVSRMSHDIRTPMNAIIGLTEIACNKCRENEVSECLTKIQSSSRFLLSLINDILDISRIEGGAMKLSAEPYTSSEFCAVIESSIGEQARRKGLTFVSRCPNEPGCLSVDKLRFNQIFINLLSNAVKFTTAGTVKLEFSFSGTSLEKTHLHATVSDTGIGIGPEFMKKLFTPFEQENAGGVSTEGTGLGLSIVKRIVDRMGGTVSAQSERGKGTTFTVELDLQTCEPPSPALPLTEGLNKLNGKRVLLVEDNEINQEVVGSILEMAGIKYDIAVNGRIALDKFSASQLNHYDAVLMDIRMPVMDGMEASRRLRTLDRPDAITVPIVALTADAYDDARQQVMQNGMTAYLAKPVYPNNLYKTLRDVCGTNMKNHYSGNES